MFTIVVKKMQPPLDKELVTVIVIEAADKQWADPYFVRSTTNNMLYLGCTTNIPYS